MHAATQANTSYTAIAVDMVEVTTENTNDRLVSAIMELKKENISLKDMIKEEREKNEVLERENREAKEQVEQYSQEISEKTKALELAKKVVNKNATFEYIRANYCRIRRSLRNIKKPEEQHIKTMQAIKDAEPKLDFYFDEQQFEESGRYWRREYSRYRERY